MDWDYPRFKAWFDEEHSKLELPDGCSQISEPQTTRAHAFSPIWEIEWYLGFADRKYLRVWERYEKVAKLIDISRRLSFSYHYGLIAKQGPDGIPVRNSDDPVEMRIDNARGIAHMHFNSPEPHIAQANVEGLDLERIDLFTFIRAIFKHRKTGKPVNKTLGFKII